jgi:hypothetical protein
MRPLALVGVTAALLVSGCSVKLADCAVECGVDGRCPRGMVCGGDGFCYRESELDDPACTERTDGGLDAGDRDAGAPVCDGESDALVAIDEASLSGTTTTATADRMPSCVTSTQVTGREIAHILTFPGQLTSLTLTTAGSAFDTVLYVKRDSCGAVDLACNDDATAATNTSRIALTSVAAGTLIVFVDEFSATVGGAYTLGISGMVASGAVCDPELAEAGVLVCPNSETCRRVGDGRPRCQP